MPYSTNTLPVGAELFHEEDGQSDMTKIIVFFHNFSNKPNKNQAITFT
jgi:hypothetical protein